MGNNTSEKKVGNVFRATWKKKSINLAIAIYTFF